MLPTSNIIKGERNERNERKVSPRACRPAAVVATRAALPDLDRLLARCTPTTDGCLLWPGATHAGYAVVRRHRKRHRLHRDVVEAALGHALPRQVFARHRCPGVGRRNCLARSHLAPGTPADNVADMIAAGRQARGETHGLHRLTTRAVREARAARASGVRYRRLAAVLGVDPSTVRRAVIGETWGHLP